MGDDMTDKLKRPVPGLEDFKPLLVAPSEFEKLAFPPEMDLPLVVTLLDAQYEREGRSTVVLNTGFQFHDKQTGRVVRVPRTYVTDFASIPGIVRGLIESFGRHARAAVLHDWLYAINEGKREDADKMAMRAMKALGVETWKRWAIYTAIKLCRSCARPVRREALSNV